MANKSKTKGKTWEREVANFLTKLYGEKFIRVPNSGAFVGGKNSFRKTSLQENQIKTFKGDIIPPDSWKYFNCECKSYANFPLHLLFTNDKISQLEAWIKQTLEASEQQDFNIILMKFNRKGKYVAYQGKWLTQMSTDKWLVYRSVDYGDWIFTDFDTFWTTNGSHVHRVVSQELFREGA
jgi:Holliday junction resolvase